MPPVAIQRPPQPLPHPNPCSCIHAYSAVSPHSHVKPHSLIPINGFLLHPTCSRNGKAESFPPENIPPQKERLFPLTLQTAACTMASKPPSGASRLRDTICFCTSWLKRSTLSVSDRTWRKPKDGTQLGNSLYLWRWRGRGLWGTSLLH